MASWKLLFALTPLAAASVLGAPQPAQALLVYNIYETPGGDVVVETSGSLTLSGSISTDFCGSNGRISSSQALICTGFNNSIDAYRLSSGPSVLNGTVNAFATSVSGRSTQLFGSGGAPVFAIESGYVSGNQIVSSATFSNTTLAGLGFTTTGLIGTWTLTNGGDQIQVFLSSSAAVPGPLPLLGAAAAFGYSRRLRRRVSQSRVAPSPAGRISA